MKKVRLILLFSTSVTILYSCKKSVEIGAPSTTLVASSVFSSPKNANGAMMGIYSNIALNISYQWSLYMGYSTDELQNYNQDNAYTQLYINGLVGNNYLTGGMWSTAYNVIFQCNSIIEGAHASSSLSASLKMELTGEAKFTRAFMYIYLVNIFGPLPLVTSTDYQSNSLLTKSSTDIVYSQIIKDCLDAIGMLPDNYIGVDGITPSNEKIRPNKVAAMALLARAYLYNRQWSQAEAISSEIVEGGNYSLDQNLNDVFLSNSSEAIWQISREPFNTAEGLNFILTTVPSSAALRQDLINQFDLVDNRKLAWIDSVETSNGTFYFPFKYKVNDQTAPVTEYVMALRLAEQYLIRAEARAQQNKLAGIDGAIADINTIRLRAGIGPYVGQTSTDSINTEIGRQRRLELFTEWGHRWIDIKRSVNVDGIMTNVALAKGGIWQTYQQLYPIPPTDVSTDPNLTQNNGY